jgi:hypothetical protein
MRDAVKLIAWRYVTLGTVQWEKGEKMLEMVKLGFARFTPDTQRLGKDNIVCDEPLAMSPLRWWLPLSGSRHLET